MCSRACLYAASSRGRKEKQNPWSWLLPRKPHIVLTRFCQSRWLVIRLYSSKQGFKLFQPVRTKSCLLYSHWFTLYVERRKHLQFLWKWLGPLGIPGQKVVGRTFIVRALNVDRKIINDSMYTHTFHTYLHTCVYIILISDLLLIWLIDNHSVTMDRPCFSQYFQTAFESIIKYTCTENGIIDRRHGCRLLWECCSFKVLS